MRQEEAKQTPRAFALYMCCLGKDASHLDVCVICKERQCPHKTDLSNAGGQPEATALW